MHDTPSSVPGGAVPTALRRPLTEVELIWVEKKMNIGFASGASPASASSRAERASSAFRQARSSRSSAGSPNNFGTVSSRINVICAVAPGEAYTTLPFVRPGGEVLLHIEGWSKVEQVLAAIDAVETAGVDPCDAAPDHWRHVHNRIAAGHQPRPYTMERHRAWLRRREIGG